MAKVRFKFHHSATNDDKEAVLRELAAAAVRDVTPLFPGQKNPELASLYSADVPDDRQADVIRQLSDRKPVVEFAEGDVKRTLIR